MKFRLAISDLQNLLDATGAAASAAAADDDSDEQMMYIPKNYFPLTFLSDHIFLLVLHCLSIKMILEVIFKKEEIRNQFHYIYVYTCVCVCVPHLKLHTTFCT